MDYLQGSISIWALTMLFSYDKAQHFAQRDGDVFFIIAVLLVLAQLLVSTYKVLTR